MAMMMNGEKPSASTRPITRRLYPPKVMEMGARFEKSRNHTA